MSKYGLVSIITSSFNCAKYIGETIESIQAQSYPDWELLITDDCSTDNSLEIIERYARHDKRIKVIKLSENGGTGVARNTSTAAKGRFIAFCDSDDLWYPTKLERQLEFMVAGDYGLTYTSYDVCDEGGHIKGYVECLPKLTYPTILRDNGIGCLTAIYDTRKMGKRYMPELHKRQDWCLWIHMIKEMGEAHGLQEPLAVYRDRSDSISAKKYKLIKYNYRVYHKELGFNHLVSSMLLGGYFLPYYFYKKARHRQIYKKRSRNKGRR